MTTILRHLPPRTTLLSLTAWCALFCAGCPFGPALPPDQEPPNQPPWISREFVVPLNNPVTVRRGSPPRVFQVTQLLDINPDEPLRTIWYSPQLGAIILNETTEGPDTSNQTLHDDLFTRYTGTEYALDPCDRIWPEGDRFTLTVFVSDANDFNLQNGTPVVGDGFYHDEYTWTLDFSGECPE